MTRWVLAALAISSLAAGVAFTEEAIVDTVQQTPDEAGEKAAESAAPETGTTLRPVDIKPEPFRDAIRTGSLEPGDEVVILERAGGWYRVKTAEHEGWVRMLSIRRGQPRKADVDLEGIVNLASGRAGTGHVIATTGIRGLSEEELKTAEFDEKELETLESFTVTPQDAQEFAAASDLVAKEVVDLPVPVDGKESEIRWPR